MITIVYQNGSIGNLIYVANCSKLLDKEFLEVHANNKTVVMKNYRQGEFFNNKKKKQQSLNGDKGHGNQIMKFIWGSKPIHTAQRANCPVLLVN